MLAAGGATSEKVNASSAYLNWLPDLGTAGEAHVRASAAIGGLHGLDIMRRNARGVAATQEG